MDTNQQPYVASGRPDLSPAGNRAGWNQPSPRSTPQPTFWPMLMALAVAVGMWGIVLDYIVVGVGVVMFAIACVGWIGDLLHE